MDKLLSILSNLRINDKYISTEINEVELFLNKVSDSTKEYQATSDEFQRKTKEIENLKEEEQSLFAEIRDRENEYVVAMDKLKDFENEHESLVRFDENGFYYHEIFRNAEYKAKLFGVDVQAEYIEPTKYQAKISFAEDKHVIFICDIMRNTFDLQEMEPRHRNFEEMRGFLQQSGDIVGFMCHVQKFFEHVT